MSRILNSRRGGKAATADMWDAALGYAERGIGVFPVHTVDANGKCSCRRRQCGSPGKHPVIEGWRQKATTNPFTIRFWWRRQPKANIGVPLSETLVVIDFDDVGAYHAWRGGCPHLAQTRTSHTGGGGYHVWVKTTELVSTYLHTGGEVRAGGAYVVVPPSRHVSGRRYRWVDADAEILTATPAELPERSSPAMAPIDVQFGGSAPELTVLAAWDVSDRIRDLIREPRPVGERSEADMSVIVALVSAGATDDEIRAVFRTYPIGAHGKYADKGPHGDHYLAHSIGKARAYVEAQAGADTGA